VKTKDDHHYHDIIEELQRENRVTTTVFAPSAAINDTGSDAAVPIQSIELCVGTRGDRHLALLDDLLAAFERRRSRGEDFAGFWAVRFTRPSRALLAMQSRSPGDAVDQRFMHVEIFALQRLDLLAPPPSFADPTRLEGDNAAFVADFAKVGADHGARLHWGQWAPPGLAHTASSYAGREAFLVAKRKLAGAHPLGVATFDSDFTVRSGLVALRPGWSATSALPTLPSHAPFDTRALRVEAPDACSDPSGRAWLVAVNGDGRVSGAPLGASWSPAGQRTDCIVEGRPALALDAAKPMVVARFDDQRLRVWRAAQPDAPWIELGIRDVVGSPSVITGADGEHTVIALAKDLRTVRAASLTPVGAGTWSTVTTFPATIAGSVVAALDHEGTLLLVARVAGEVRFIALAKDGTRSEGNLGLSSLVDPTISVSPAGTLILAVDVGRPVAMWRAAGTSSFVEVSIPGASAALASTRVGAVARGLEHLVAFTDTDGHVQRRTFAQGAWRVRPAIPASAVSGPGLALHRGANGHEVLVIATRLAHDLVQTCTEALA
jgi:hypothetical protein